MISTGKSLKRLLNNHLFIQGVNPMKQVSLAATMSLALLSSTFVLAHQVTKSSVGQRQSKTAGTSPESIKAKQLAEIRRLRDQAMLLSLPPPSGSRISQETYLRNQQKAPHLAQRALALALKAFGPEHPEVADCLSLVASFSDDSDEKKRLNLQALAIKEKALGPEHPDLVGNLHTVADISIGGRDYEKAEALLLRAFLIEEKGINAKKIYNLIFSAQNLAAFYEERKHDTEKALSILQRALTRCENVLGAEHIELWEVLMSLANTHKNKGDYIKADSFYQRALAIAEKAPRDQRELRIVQTSGELAKLYIARGDYQKAEPLLQRKFAREEKDYGPGNPSLVGSLSELVLLYYATGEYEKAAPVYRRALYLMEKGLLLIKVPFAAMAYASEIRSLVSPYWTKKDFDKAEAIVKTALEIVTKTLDAEHPGVAAVLHSQATLYRVKGDTQKAEPIFRNILALTEKALGPEHAEVAIICNELAVLSSAQGNYPEAVKLYQRALAIMEKGGGTPVPPGLLQNLALAYDASGDKVKAVEFLTRSNEINEQSIHINLSVGSERQKRAYLDTFLPQVHYTLSLHTQSAPDDAKALHLALTTLLRHKGRGLDAMTDSIASLRQQSSAAEQALFDQLAAVHTRLATLTLREPGNLDAAEYRSQLSKLEEMREKLEGEISTRSARFRAQLQAVTPEAVQALLPSNTALVEFAAYLPYDTKPNQWARQPRYVAYVLPSQGPLHWVDLGEAVPIYLAIESFRQTLLSPTPTNVKAVARALDEKVMQPVRKLLGETKHVLLSPDGALNLIPFAALVDEQNRFLVETYSFSYLTSGRDLLRLQTSSQSNNTQLVVADPDFGPKTGTAAKQEAVTTGRSFDLSKAYFAPLPGTAGEAQALQDLLPKATVLTRDKATEAALKQTNSPSILHIATHGFFLEDVPPDPASLRVQRQLVHQSALGDALFARRLENPLLRSGLGLAGANLKKSGEDDGILTALEVAGLNLWGTKLVVLSACETGVGEVKTGDGVYGLRRALVLAGSESQVMSLWKVDDAATRDLMVEYYKRLQAGEGRSEAMRQVQLQMLRGQEQSAGHQARTPDVKPLREEKPSFTGRSHPYYWASFIQSGEWANLAGKR
ncbi:MAG: CHAT domain-containing protein [Acidobacteria bacterium]|nr:CHAT domain-containing protein [Acidobacteriota bacterium]